MRLVLRTVTHRKHSVSASYYYYYLFDKYLLSMYYTASIVVGTADKIIRQIDVNFPSRAQSLW